MESVFSPGSCFPFSEPHSEAPDHLSFSPAWRAEKRKEAEGVYWALVPPSICLLVWGGEGASDADPALGKPGVIQEILQTYCPLSSAPLA